ARLRSRRAGLRAQGRGGTGSGTRGARGAPGRALRLVPRTEQPDKQHEETMNMKSFLVGTAALALLAASSLTHAQETVDTHIGTLTFESGYPSQETVAKLYDEMDFQRACQAYLWGIPAVGMAEWRLAHRDIMRGQNGQMLSYLSFQEKL